MKRKDFIKRLGLGVAVVPFVSTTVLSSQEDCVLLYGRVVNGCDLILDESSKAKLNKYFENYNQ